jgi:hypothetical protein
MAYNRQILAADINKCMLNIKNNIKIPVASLEDGLERPKTIVQMNCKNFTSV